MIRQKIDAFMSSRRCTLLGIGPMSRNCVDAAIELANEQDAVILLIASRRQIEAAEFDGGYVNNWSTEDFAKYVIDRDLKGRVILARDHGGPWQNTFEQKQGLSLRRAMETAKTSYRVDIQSGIEAIHIDPSIDIHGSPSVDEVLLRIFELYEYCWRVAQEANRDIIFEIGTEEQSGVTNSLDELEYVLRKTLAFCKQERLPTPTFVVVQTGTKVLEARNVGSFDTPFRISGELPAEIQVPRMLDLCRKYGIYMKEHNTDYLSDDALAWHPKLGIHAANVAPEFGVAETKAFLTLLREWGLEKEAQAFLELAYESRKWEKWMIPGSNATDLDRAIVAGHYVFADSRFAELKASAQAVARRRREDVDMYLKSAVKAAIARYFKGFNLMRYR